VNCRNCGKPIVRRRAEDEFDTDKWVHDLTGRTSCYLFAAPPDSRDVYRRILR
jgi:hypothetical protein